jgi:HEPN domain-containing protein
MLATGADIQPYHVCFWAQQAAEKALKAALIYAAIPLIRPMTWMIWPRACQLAGGRARTLGACRS